MHAISDLEVFVHDELEAREAAVCDEAPREPRVQPCVRADIGLLHYAYVGCSYREGRRCGRSNGTHRSI